jgi:hypothetical protein
MRLVQEFKVQQLNVGTVQIVPAFLQNVLGEEEQANRT